MSKHDGHNKALALAKEKLNEINLQERLTLLGFENSGEKEMSFRLFGKDALFIPASMELSSKDPEAGIKMDETILFFHYLLCEVPIKQGDDFITFRELSGGQFYWNPFRSRTVLPLVKRFGNDLDLLQNHLDRFDWKSQTHGDFSAEIHALGNIYILLVYHLGDDEFPAAADLLFSRSIKYVYNAEDVAVLASRICLGLL